MANDISGFGALVTIVASNTFPAGLPITQFSDDSDPVDISSISIKEVAMGLNGDLIQWSRANPLPVDVNVIPGSDDDVALGILAEANRVGRGKVSANDVITLNVIYPDGTSVTFTNGAIIEAMFGKSIASQGRLKSKKYSFRFENKVGN